MYFHMCVKLLSGYTYVKRTYPLFFYALVKFFTRDGQQVEAIQCERVKISHGESELIRSGTVYLHRNRVGQRALIRFVEKRF